MLRSIGYLLLLALSLPAHAGMMGGMMGPSGTSAPAPTNNAAPSAAKGYQLTQQFCVQCHQSPSPNLHTAGDWPSVISRMIGHMREQGIRFPNQGEEQAILEYLSQQ